MGSSIISKPKLDYNHSIEKAIEPKSKQAVMGRFEIYPLWCTKVKGNAAFSEGLVESLLAQHIARRRRSDLAMQPVRQRCAAFFLVDRIRFQGYKFQRWISYRQILHYYQYKPSSHIFVLFVVDRKTFHRSYQSFECVYPEDADRIQEFVNQIMQDPQRMIETGSTKPEALVNQSLIAPYSMNRNPTMFQIHYEEEDDNLEMYNALGSCETSDSPHIYEGSNGLQTSSTGKEVQVTVRNDNNELVSFDSASNVYPTQKECHITRNPTSQLPVARTIVVSK